MKKYLSTIIRAGMLFILIVLLIVLSILKNNPEICEAMTRGFSRMTNGVMSAITSWVPFSLTELLFVLLVAGIIFLLVQIIRGLIKKQYRASIHRAIEIAAIIFLSIDLYTLSCEFAYNREQLPLPYYANDIERTEHIPIYNYFAEDINLCISSLEFDENGEVKTEMSLEDISNEVIKAYSIIEGNDYYASYFGGVKPMLSSFIYREFQITGVTYSPLMEANINTLNTQSNLPLTIAHELAHTKGVMREDDANQLAFYVCLNSEHPYLRYSAYVSYYYQLAAMVTSYYLTEEEMAYVTPIDATLNKTRRYVYEYWQSHDLLGDIGEFFNDLYIKMSGVKEGTISYSGGSTYEHDPLTSKLIPSLYQRLFFEKYYRLKSV